MNHGVGVQVWRHALKNAEAVGLGVTIAEQAIAAMSGLRVGPPAAVDVVGAIGRADVAFAVRRIEDEVDPAPLCERGLPTLWQGGELLP